MMMMIIIIIILIIIINTEISVRTVFSGGYDIYNSELYTQSSL
jgi:hypothetical protein